MEIYIYRGAEHQHRKLSPDVTEERAMALLYELFEEDYLGCDLFQLLDDNGNTLLELEPD